MVAETRRMGGVLRGAAFGLACLTFCVSLPVAAQTVELPSGMSMELQRRLEGLQNQPQTPQVNPLDESRERGLTPLPQQSPQDRAEAALLRELMQRPSPVETAYRERLDRDEDRKAPQHKLKQFGYELWEGQPPRQSQLLSGAVPDDYVMGIGDEVVVTFRGQVNRTETVRVDREGRVTLEDIAPVPAAGRRFEEFRSQLEAVADSTFLGTQIYVSLGAVRAISVTVAGEVAGPGLYRLTSFSSVLDLLQAAGGVSKTGSLRNLTLFRQGNSQPIDLYALLMGQSGAADLRLQDGDRLLVPALGRTVAVAGNVVRPGIFELSPRGGALQVSDLLAFAGGALRAQGNRLRLRRLDEAGRNMLIEADATSAVRPNDILMVELPRAAVAVEGAVELPGERALAQAGSLAGLLQSREVLAADPYLPFAVIRTEDPQTRVQRFVPVDLQRVLGGNLNVTLRPEDRVLIFSRSDIAYLASADVQAVLRGQTPPSLLLSVEEMEQMRLRDQMLPGGSAAAQLPGLPAWALRGEEDEPAKEPGLVAQVEIPESRSRQGQGLLPQAQVPGLENRQDRRFVRSEFSCAGLQSLAALVADGAATRFLGARRQPVDLDQFGARRRGPERRQEEQEMPPVINVQKCPKLFDRYPDLLPLALEYASSLDGELRQPGIYPVLPGTPAMSVVAAAGGLTLDADDTSLELIRADGSWETQLTGAALSVVTISPGDTLRANAKASLREQGIVEIAGEVGRPGRYVIRRGETLSALLQRVEGLTAQAYPYGAVFTRARVREAEREGYRRTARELELSIPTAVASAAREDAATIAAAVPALQVLVERLRTTEPLGRVVVEADPTVLAANPSLDFVLESGDRLFIPKRPAHVTVSGEVLSPTAVMFKSGRSVRDYIRLAGGESPSAELRNAFIIYPNGESEPAGLGRWSNGDVLVPPGSTIVVPRDPQPFSFLQLTQTVLAVVRDLAVAAASLAVISQ